MKSVIKALMAFSKYVFFGSLILIFGQIPVRNGTVASHFVTNVDKALHEVGVAVKRSSAYAAISQWPLFSYFLLQQPKNSKEEIKKSQDLHASLQVHGVTGKGNKVNDGLKSSTKSARQEKGDLEELEMVSDSEEMVSTADRESLMQLLR